MPSRPKSRLTDTGGGWLFFKMNSLVDKDLIRALYAASQAACRSI